MNRVAIRASGLVIRAALPLFLVLLALLGVACSDTATPTLAPMLEPSAIPTPTPTPTPAYAAVPARTPTGTSTVTPSIAPTVAHTPSPVPTAIPTPMPTPTRDVDATPDTTPPSRSNGVPFGGPLQSAGTTLTTIFLDTDDTARCRYATVEGVAYAAMTDTFTNTGGIKHSTLVTGLLSGITFSYFVRCVDDAGNKNTNDFLIKFSVAAPVNREAPNPSGLTGITGTTSSGVISGIPGGGSTVGPGSIEFAIAPIEGQSPAYEKAIFVTSDAEGKYEIILAPGAYWIGAEGKALDPTNYASGAIGFLAKVAFVKEGTLILIDISQVGFAP